jgi:hypothetical protein
MAGFGSFGMGLQIVGMASSAIGAYYGAQGQKQALSAQAELDKINARSTAMAMNGQADLDLMNAKAGFESMQFGASMNMLGTERNIFDAKSGAALNTLNATTASAATILQAGTQASLTLTNAYGRAAVNEIQAGMQSQALDVGAQISQMNAGLLELQAQSTMLHGEWREQDSRLQYAQAKSRATVQMARGNLDLSEGTPLQMRVGIDVMSERAAIMIQQDTLMQAFGQRQQASNLQLDAALKHAQAQGVLAVSAAQNKAEITLAEAAASGAVTLAQLQANAMTQQAALKSALTDMGAEFDLKIAQSQSDWTAAMAHAGMLQAEAAAQYKHTMADVLVKNSSAAAAVKTALADGISPGMAAFSSILSGAGQVARNWYPTDKAGA